MQRDAELIRKILLAIEASPTGYAPSPLTVEGYTPEVIGYHCLLILEEGLAAGQEVTGLEGPPEALLTRLTVAGHALLDAQRGAYIAASLQPLRAQAGMLPVTALGALDDEPPDVLGEPQVHEAQASARGTSSLTASATVTPANHPADFGDGADGLDLRGEQVEPPSVRAEDEYPFRTASIEGATAEAATEALPGTAVAGDQPQATGEMTSTIIGGGLIGGVRTARVQSVEIGQSEETETAQRLEPVSIPSGEAFGGPSLTVPASLPAAIQQLTLVGVGLQDLINQLRTDADARRIHYDDAIGNAQIVTRFLIPIAQRMAAAAETSNHGAAEAIAEDVRFLERMRAFALDERVIALDGRAHISRIRDRRALEGLTLTSPALWRDVDGVTTSSRTPALVKARWSARCRYCAEKTRTRFMVFACIYFEDRAATLAELSHPCCERCYDRAEAAVEAGAEARIERSETVSIRH